MLCPSCRAENPAGATLCRLCGRPLGELVAGTLFASRYEILAPLGRGGMGAVFKALDRELDEVVALKVLRADVAGTPEMERRFRSEIKLARRVSHRNVCRLHDYGEAQGLRYVCMAYVEGHDLKQAIRERSLTDSPFGIAEAVDIARQVAEAKQISGERTTNFEEINLIAHELRGQGGTFGYPLITVFGKSLYELTKPPCRQDDASLEIVKAHIDTMRAVLRDKIEGDGGEVGQMLFKALKMAIAKYAPPAAQ